MATTPKSNTTHFAQLRTPSSKHRLQFKINHASPNPSSALKENQPPLEHPVEVIGRIRDYPDRQKERPTSGSGLFHINPDRETIRVRTDIGYRDFSLDGVSSSEDEDLESFYKKFIESRIVGVKMGAKCTIMMYGPTGSGKSHNMFGCPKQPGIVYRSLKDILGEDGEEKGGVCGLFVHVTVLEIYNEEIYDLLSCEKASGGFNIWSKGSASKVKLEVMGKKAKNATFILGTEAAKLSKEIQKVEKRRIVKSTNCNDRSSRSHCMIILDVPTVGGRLMLVDMAGSENIEQAGQVGFEAKMQTAKINQGNTALKRVVESIANGDSHVPFRDSKLTMLLQDSFEDDKSKILMILCASPDPKEMHKTISTLEYGAKAKCIIRGPHTPVKDKNGAEDMSSTVVLGSRIAAMDQFILKLQMENKQREKERNEAHKQLVKKEEEVSQLRAKLEQMQVQGSGASEEEINVKVNERMQMLKQELDKQLQECQRMASEYVELERKRMEEKIIQQQQEVLMLRRRLEEMELELNRSRDGSSSDGSGSDLDGIGLARRLKEMYADEDPGMEKSMDLDMGDQESYGREVKIVGGVILNRPSTNLSTGQGNGFTASISDRVCLSTVFEEEEVEDGTDDQKAKPEDEEVEKEVIEEKRVLSAVPVDKSRTSSSTAGSCGSQIMGESTLDSESSRRMRIQNIFTLCGNYRELSRHIRNPEPAHPDTENADPQSVSVTSQYPVENSMRASNTKETTTEFPVENSMRASNTKETTTEFPVGSPIKESRLLGTPVKNVMQHLESKENMNSGNDQTTTGALMDIYVKWEATKESQGKFISKLRIVKDASLADLRKLIAIHLGIDRQDFTFLALGDPTGAPVPREKEATVSASKLPACNNQLGGHLACLRPAKGVQVPSHMPFSSLENKLPITPISCLKQQQADSCSPNLDSSLGSTPFVTVRR